MYPHDPPRTALEQPRPSQHTDGFTMTELLMTMLLLTIVLTGLAALQMSTIRQVTVSKRAGEATRLAQRVLERYKTIRYSNIVIPSSPAWFTELTRGGAPMSNIGVDGESDGPFTVQSLTEASNGGALITVRVTWTSINRGLETIADQQYRQFSVTNAIQRFE